MVEKLNSLPNAQTLLLFSLIFLCRNASIQAQCTGLGSITFTVLAPPEPTLTFDSQICPGQTSTIEVNETFSDYDWSNGQSGQSITVSAGGTYTVTVSNATGCSATAQAVVTQTTGLSVNLTSPLYNCSGNLTINASGNFPDYEWSTGETGSSISVSSNGTYSVTASDAAGCTGSATFTATIPADPDVAITGNLSFCGSGSSTLTATAGFQSYQWSGGIGNGNIRTVSAAGDYTVTVSNQFGCTDTETVTVVQQPNASPTLDAPDPICSGQSTTIAVTNGPFNTYAWSTGANTPTITVSTAGNFSVTVTDAAGCTGTAATALVVNQNPTVSISSPPYDCDGTQTLNASGSFPDYEWSTGETGASISTSAGGTFSVTATNSVGCTGAANFTVSIPSAPEVLITGDFSFCENLNTVLTATAGFQNYQWSGGTGNGNIRTVSTAGNYTVTVTDQFGCTDTETVAVNEQPAPVPQLNSPDPVCAGETAEIQVLNPTFQNYQWSNGSSGSTITVSIAGNYVVTVTDAVGCTGTDATSLNVLQNPNVTAAQLAYDCDGQRILTATAGFSNYQWSNGASGQTTTVQQANTYIVTVTGANGCSSTATVDAEIPDDPQVNITGATTVCAGFNATFNATPGFQIYQWSTGQGSPSISVGTSGTYFVTVTDDFGCTATASESLDVNPVPAPQITGATQICAGGTATFAATGGSFNNFLWSNGSQTPTITVGNAGNYSLTVTDAAGCTGTDAILLTVGTELDIEIAEQPYQCNGQIALDAGAGFLTYAWSNGATTPIINVSQNGDFTVTVSDATGCTGMAAVAVSIPDAPQAEVTGAVQICAGTTTMLIATPGFVEYFWSNGQLNPTISVGTAGNFQVTVSDDNGCTATADFDLAVVAAPQPVIAGTATICQNSSATLSVPGNFQSFNWSTGATTPTIQVSQAGNFAVTVSNSAGCTGSDDFVLTVNTSLQPQIFENPYACDGQITLDAGAGFQNYAWSNGATGPTISVSQAGNFGLTVSDASGCTGATSIAVSIPQQPQVSIFGNPNFCAGGLTAISAAAGFQNYAWSSGATTAEILVSQAGSFAVTATDATGCTSTATVLVLENALPQPQILGSTTLCNGSATTLSANQNFQKIEWSTGETTAQISVSAAGNVGLTVTDAAGCTALTSVNLTVATSLSPQISQNPYACDGQITLDAGAGFQNYAWSNGATGQTISVSQAGNFVVTVSDANSCTGATSIAVSIPQQPQVSIFGNPNFCAGGSTAISAAAGFQNYAWASGAATAEITVSAAGNFAVTATDANGCTSTATISVLENALPQPQILGSTTLCNGAAATLSANQNFQKIEWSTGETTAQISVSAAGNVGLTVTDANGCTASTSVNLTVATSLSPQISQNPYACDGQITLDAGAGFQNYAWSNGATGQTTSVLQNGNFVVTVSDANGCTGTATQAVQIPTPPTLQIAGDASFCAGDSTVLTASGTGVVEFSWSNGATTPKISVSQADLVSVTATDALGCTVVAAVFVSEKQAPVPQILGSTTLCNGNPTTLFLSDAYQNYLWSTGQTSASIQVLQAGTVGLTVTDFGGCTASTTIPVTVGNTLSPQIAVVSQNCSGLVGLGTGNAFETWQWSNGSTIQIILVDESGDYSVTVSDANGCTGSASIFVQVPGQFSVAVSGQNTFCAGGSTTISATAGFQNYEWSNGATTPEISVSQGGNFVVTVSDANGCTGTATISVLENALPQPQILGSTTLCNGAATTLSANQNFQKIEWSTGETTAQISVSTAGNVGLTVTDAAGCTASTSVNLTVATSLSPQISQNPYACDGQITLDAGAGFQNYAWSNGATGQTISVSQNGNFAVTVSDANGCTGATSVAVSIPQQPQVSISGNPNFCAGGLTSISATAGFQKYEWSNGAATAQISVSQGGNFVVTATDANGCTSTAAVSVLEKTAEKPLISGSSTICVGGSTVLSISNASNFSQFLWSDGATGSQISVAAAGNFSVTATDAAGCTAAADFAVTVGNSLAPTINEGVYLCDGKITLEAPAGFQNYEWSNGGGAAQISVSSDGNYFLTVTDATGCTGTASIFVEVPDAILVVVQTPATPICAGGSANLSVPPGFANYAWSTGATSQGIQISVEGTFAVTVTDIYGCTATDDFEFEFAENPIFEIAGEPFLDCENQEARLRLDLQNVAQPAQFSWSDGSAAAEILAKNAGVFSATVTDANGCTATAEVEVLKNSILTTFADTLEFRVGDVLDLVPPSAGFSPAEIVWSPVSILNCADCSVVKARPTEDVRVDFSGKSGDCSQVGYFYLISKVKKKPAVFVPNAISLSSSDNNVLTLFGNELVLKINYLRVFTRWGELVEELQDLTPGDVSRGWRGDFRGKPVDMGVFVWVAEVLFSDGTTEIFKGDVTVFR